MNGKQYKIAYGNIFQRMFSVFLQLIITIFYCCAVSLIYGGIAFLIYILIDSNIAEIEIYYFYAFLIPILIFDIVQIAIVIINKPKIILTEKYIYIKRTFFDEYSLFKKELIILYKEIAKCEKTRTPYSLKLFKEVYVEYIRDKDCEITLTTQKGIKYIFSLSDYEDFINELYKRIEETNTQ